MAPQISLAYLRDESCVEGEEDGIMILRQSGYRPIISLLPKDPGLVSLGPVRFDLGSGLCILEELTDTPVTVDIGHLRDIE